MTAFKASHTSVITMCFKENVASIEVNRIRGYSRLCALTRIWREGRALNCYSEPVNSRWLTAQNMECITEVTRVEDEDTNKHINPP